MKRFLRPLGVSRKHLFLNWGLPVGSITPLRDPPIFKLFYLSRQKIEIQYAYYSYKMEYNDMHMCGLTPQGRETAHISSSYINYSSSHQYKYTLVMKNEILQGHIFARANGTKDICHIKIRKEIFLWYINIIFTWIALGMPCLV